MNRLNYDYQGPFLKNIGRFYINEKRKAQMLTFSCSGFEIVFYGTKLEAYFLATECGKKDGEGAIAVVIDETPFSQAKKVVLNKPEALYTLAKDLDLGIHHLKVYRRTESACSHMGWQYLITDGEFRPLASKKRLQIEFYGDSITAGNGVEGLLGDDNFETRTENALLSYAALTSEKLRADFSIVAIGGYPLYKSPWTALPVIKNIPQMFAFADYDWGTDFTNYISWDNHKFVPDIVVINLGTNDEQYLNALPSHEVAKEEEAFCTALRNFIQQIKSAYPQAKIILTIGMIQVQKVEKLIYKVSQEYPKDVYYMKFNSLSSVGFMPNGGHPNAGMHVAASEQLAAFIKAIN
ncbi:MAG: GDSL-type esterase/lipase family protein [Bacilli bacterium]|nr:GDSL-type esterase/lipase family protein [Bacilli bacterium]